MADEWEAAGFKPAGEQPADPWIAAGFKPVPTETPGPSLLDIGGQGVPEQQVPPAFLDRIAAGEIREPTGAFDLMGWLKKAAALPSEAAGAELEHIKQVHSEPASLSGLVGGALRTASLPFSLIDKGTEKLLDTFMPGRPTGDQAPRLGGGITPSDALGMVGSEFGMLRFSRRAQTAAGVLDQAIGSLPKPADFETGATVLTGVNPTTGTSVRTAITGQGADAAAQNLRTLWDERGIHPAEAVHDAQRDAFLRQDLVTPDKAPPDKSGIPPVQSTPVVTGTPRAELAKTGEPHIDEVLESSPTQTVINNPIVNRETTTPYTAGGSVPLEDPTIFIDYRFPHSFTIDGVTFDAADPFIIHENVEQHVMELLIKGGMPVGPAYRVSHFEWAEKAEGAWYRAHGISQAKAEAAYAPIMARIQHEPGARPVAPNLYKRPYPHDNPSAALKEPIAEARPTPEEIEQAKKILASQRDQADLEGAAPIEPGEQPAAPAKPAAFGPAAKPAETYSLLEYLASKGGLKSNGELETIFGGKNKKVFGFGNVIRKGGMTMDEALQAAKDGGYLRDTAELEGRQQTVGHNDLLELIDKEARGEKQYREGAQEKAKPAELEEHRHRLHQELDETLHEVGIDPASVSDKVRDRAVRLMEKERLAPDIAYERASMEVTEHGAAAGEHERVAEEIPGWDVPDDTGAAPAAGRPAAEGGQLGAREEPRQPGEADREPPGGPKPGTSAGADVTRPENLPSLKTQPAPRPGSLAASARASLDQLLGLGRNIQYLLDPMATGSKRAMVIAKDAMNSVRRIRWEHTRMDAELMTSPELKAARDRLGETIGQQHERMWNAADEESVAQQLGESTEHQGLVTLEPEERAFVERLHANAQAAWLHAVDVGMVEGEGLPAYTPRMVLNVGAGAEHLGPQALNELGRNVFTRTGQMKFRKFMTAEETEEAAKRAIGKRMAESGASQAEIDEAMAKVQIGRNIRALPLATARLEEAAVWREMINKIEDAGKAAGEATVSTGRPNSDRAWFTIAGNPAFTKWEPALERSPTTGKWGARTDDGGNVLFVPKQLYVAGDFAGPLKSILDPGVDKLVPGAQSLYGALMTIKGKAMTAILNSPLIHNEVVWGKVMEAAGGREWLGFGLYWKGNRIVEGNPARASELIERGLNPMGPRGAIQDITGIMEQPDVIAGHHVSWSGKVAGFIPGLYDEAKGQVVERAIAKAGDFWHNTLLWNRVRDVQFGLADHLSDRLVAHGADRLTADRVATHFANIIVGSIPKEAMSAGARATANLLLFSRSFTLGNLSTFKQAALGLPAPILAQIERDAGMSAGAALGPEAAAIVAKDAKSIARRKALATIGLSAGLYYVGNSLLQNAFNIVAKDSSVGEELQGYARRFASFMTDVKSDPFELRHLIGRLSPVYDNEPTKQDRVHIGYASDGTAIYARNPVGKFGEEMVGYPTQPLEMVKRKLSPLAGGLLEVLENDKGFGRKIYDENDKTLGGDVANIFNAAKHLVMRHMPEGQIGSALDLLHGEGDRTVNALRTFAPMAGFTVSEGAAGGPARGEQLAAKQAFDARFNLAWPDIKKQAQRGDVAGAREALTGLGVPPGMQNGLIRNALNPAAALHGRTLRDFYTYATPEQRERLERDLQNAR